MIRSSNQQRGLGQHDWQFASRKTRTIAAAPTPESHACGLSATLQGGREPACGVAGWVGHLCVKGGPHLRRVALQDRSACVHPRVCGKEPAGLHCEAANGLGGRRRERL